jgi:hypothetical protein
VSFDSLGMSRVRATLSKARAPIDAETIAERAHIGVRTFTGTYQQLLLPAGLIHIADWRRNVRGPAIPLFAAGTGVTPPKPGALSDAEVSRRWKERTGYNELRNLNRKLVRPVDPILAALMGLPSRGRHFKEHHINAGHAPAEGN